MKRNKNHKNRRVYRERKKPIIELPRIDVTRLATFTIDPKTAKDFDDALSVEFLPDGTTSLGVHIADVTHYVLSHSPVDIEAEKKATSVYLLDAVEHMLPRHLSEDRCSLTPGSEKYALSIFFRIDASGLIISSSITQTKIISKHRFTYRQAQEVYERGAGVYHEELNALYKLSRIWRKEREKNGAVEFDSDEVEVIKNQHGIPTSITPKALYESMKVIEECMLLANKTIAEFVLNAYGNKQGIGMYRVHDGPHGEKLLFLLTMLREMKYPVTLVKGKVPARELQQVMKKAQDGERDCLKMILLRSMGKAYYSPVNSGHYALTLPAYTHFTSPIRRYPDICVHRIVKSILSGVRLTGGEIKKLKKIAKHATDMEILAQERERAAIKEMQVQYMKQKIGKKYVGVITGVMPYGIFVREKHSFAEGFIHARALSNEYVHHEPHRHVLRNSKESFSLGKTVQIRVDSVDEEKGFINYALDTK